MARVKEKEIKPITIDAKEIDGRAMERKESNPQR